MDCKIDVYDAIEQQTGTTSFTNQMAMDIENMPITIDGVDIPGTFIKCIDFVLAE